MYCRLLYLDLVPPMFVKAINKISFVKTGNRAGAVKIPTFEAKLSKIELTLGVNLEILALLPAASDLNSV